MHCSLNILRIKFQIRRSGIIPRAAKKFRLHSNCYGKGKKLILTNFHLYSALDASLLEEKEGKFRYQQQLFVI